MKITRYINPNKTTLLKGSDKSLKIIINRQNPIVVEDEDGHIMYTYQPIDDQELDKMTLDEQDAYIEDAIRDCYK